ncbi:hypothetical protein EV360DRAFT_90232 [Lentinula raphanica]|nr:hypothetical protein EV360DRAFT_90232 [Lentinula raphanica]
MATSSSPITQVSQTPTHVNLHQPQLLTRLLLDLRGKRYEVDRETIMNLPESVLLCLFPNGLVLSRQSAALDGGDEDEEDVYAMDFDPDCFQFVLSFFRNASESFYGVAYRLLVTIPPNPIVQVPTAISKVPRLSRTVTNHTAQTRTQSQAAQRGSVQILSTYPGDPTTPGIPAYETATRTEAKDGWNGTIRLNNQADERVMPIWNTMAVTPGHIKDEVVTLGKYGFGRTMTDAVYRYHSVHDSEQWEEMYADPGFHHHVAVAKHLGLVTLRLAGSIVLPLNTTHYAYEIENYLDM